MSELLPTMQAEAIRRGLVDYLGTTFALSDADALEALTSFLADPVTGMFKGPYARLRLPFRPADDGWRDALAWYEGFVPYGHQAAAFARLSSFVDGKRRRPQPTLVTTGTGSGKTEAFLYPILDHVLRARREGITGMKALILYPMNALANDQAQRLAQMICGFDALSGVTAALYTGQAGPTRTKVTPEGLITDRAVIRETAPDILLTNYKMLDQLLLRRDDQGLWRQSALSLQYLVLDEFHTYDGAQGTDVAMLLRRLGLALKSYWSTSDARLDAGDWSRPLGRVTPVATSATLGDKGDPMAMLGFAGTVFGEAFDADAVITESRLALDEWVGDAPQRVADAGIMAVPISSIDVDAANAAVAALGHDPAAALVCDAVLASLFVGDVPAVSLLDASRSHPLVQAMATAAADAIGLDDLVDAVVPSRLRGADSPWATYLSHVIAMLGHVRAVTGRAALSVDVHLWIRELTRIDRAADSTARFWWGDDGPPVAGLDIEDARPAFPAVYCRHCGRSGWGVSLAPAGLDLAADDAAIRRSHAMREGRFRALMYAPAEAALGEATDGLMWFAVRSRMLLGAPPAEDDPDVRDGWVLPVLTCIGSDAERDSRNDQCPSCGQDDGIRFLGSAIATLLSVSLSTLFGSGELDPAEKKALVFTDSVQDAAHRAGFVQARSHTLTLRAVLREAVSEGPLTLDAIVDEVIRRAGDDPFARYRIIAPDCADRDSFAPFWSSPTLRSVSSTVRSRVRRRLAFDAAMEFGLNSRVGRTLELTGSVAVEVQAHPERMLRAARAALEGYAWPEVLDGTGPSAEPDEGTRIGWVRGILERMRAQGAIDHEWFLRYRAEDGSRYSIWGGRPRDEGMPAFPRGRPAPGYPRIGGSLAKDRETGLDPVTAQQSWYARWTSRALGVSPADGGRLARLLLERLAKDDILLASPTQSGATVYALRPSGVVVAPTDDAGLASGSYLLACGVCRALTPGTPTVVAQLAGAPCLTVRCHGYLAPMALAEGFYRRLYATADMRRVVAREHTSLLDDEIRLAYENGFKGAVDDPQAPNVLVATPTLELGIDIGDLSAVFLSSLPATVASYLQRVGRAGRLTGNALNLAYVTGRGEHLPRLGDPLSVINGEVRPPATYLEAEEILRRQFTAHLVDLMARDPGRTFPRTASGAIGSSEPGTFLGDLIALAESEADAHVDRFAATLDSVAVDALASLRAWVVPGHGPGTSGLAAHLHAASGQWQSMVDTLRHRRDAIDAALPELEAKALSPAATDDDRRALRSAQIARKLTNGQLAHLQGEYWIGVLEEYGILPNYTLLDDSVTLDVGLSWIDPDTGTFQVDHAQIQRGSAQAIREFAPGATFYARGWEIEIDAVDLGMDGEAVRPWAFCPACGYGVDVEAGGRAEPVLQCPRCGCPGIADSGQRIDAVELAHASAEVRRDEATISDRSDQRAQAIFQMFFIADVDPAHFGKRWFIPSTGLGCTYLRSVDLRWLNGGPPGSGTRIAVGGSERPAARFRLCASCGKLDTDTGRNRRHEHRPWCAHRASAIERTRQVVLTRTMRTQGLLLRLPNAVTVGDEFAMPSLSAAILLGLREQIGGHPDHLRVERAIDPTFSDGSQNHDGLLLHDIVPGGTGYLAELATPEILRGVLLVAWERVRDCPCQLEGRQACHRCLLPFAAPGSLGHVSRAAAERHLRTLIGLPPEAMQPGQAPAWEVSSTPPDDTHPESHLEQRFRKVLIDRLRAVGATINEVPGAWGNTVNFVLPDAVRQWTLRPQVYLDGARPDFVLQSSDVTLPMMAIFTDGHAFHATPERNRLADDAGKRQILRDAGRLVLAVTARDVAEAEVGTASAPAWFADAAIGEVIGYPPFMAPPAEYQALRTGPIDFLISWVAAASTTSRTAVARAVPMLVAAHVAASQQRLPVPADLPLAVVARGCALGEDMTQAGSERGVAVWRFGALAVAVEQRGPMVDVAAVLDDRSEALDANHADAWREWLRLSNALALRDWPTTITTTSLVATLPLTSGPSTAIPGSVVEEVFKKWAPGWVEVHRLAASQAEAELIIALATRGVVPPPVLGFEGPDGIPIDMSWPGPRIVVDLPGIREEDRLDLVAAGWTFVEPEPDRIEAILVGAAGGNPGSNG